MARQSAMGSRQSAQRPAYPDCDHLQPAAGEAAPLAQPTRTGLVWDGPHWREVDAATADAAAQDSTRGIE